MVAIGAHVDSSDPVTAARATGADAAQFFLSDPQGWKAPLEHPHAAEIKASDLTIYIHAPYLVNVATMNNKIRIPSRKIMTQHAAAAAAIGAKGLIVHGGHVTGDTDVAAGVSNWVNAGQQIERPLPLLIENTAGGEGAMARSLEAIARLWEAVSEAAEGGGELGFCLDTCHANSAGIELADAVDRVKAITGRIDLVHCNNSRDEFNSGADRHANFTAGTIDPALLLGVVRAAGATVICETPEENGGLAADVSWLQANLGAGTAERAGA